MKTFEPFSVILLVLKDGAHSSGEDDKGAETVDVFKKTCRGVQRYFQVEEMYRGEFDIGAEKKLSLNIEDTRCK